MIARLQFSLIILMLLGAPLIAGGKSINSLLFLEVTGISLLAITYWQGNILPKLPKLAWITLSLGLAIPLIYLIPIPVSLWQILPGRDHYTEALVNYHTLTNSYPWLSLSMVPEKTMHAALALLPPLAIFTAALVQPIDSQIKITYVLIAVACLEALLGMAQYTTESATFFPFGAHNDQAASGDAVGTYINRDHFVVFLYLTLPLVLSQFFFQIGSKAFIHRHRQDGFRTRAIIGIGLITLAILFLIIGATLSRSRAGIFLIVLAILLSTLIFARHIGGKRGISLASTLAIVSIVVASSIGIIPVLNRFIALDPFEDGRWWYFQVALEGIKQFFPLGTGPSTFQELYRTIQPYDQLQFLNHVHNDYLELVFETGLIGIVFVALFFIVYIRGWINLRKFTWDEARFLKTAAGISVTLLLLHALVDFNFHTPANALMFSFLLAIFLKRKEP
ncbi:MAG: O-antigen ligase domain-containing protein [Thiothrix sp.]|nr:MAG: O-antigen ligase domain-containing protein [Thiothrix sp.]